jgi:two-component system, sensor histidine kinase and response regulator
MPQRILVIDDEQPTLELMRITLSREPYEVLLADSGALGLEMVREKKPDLVICDIAMPEVNGYHVIDTIRKEEDHHTPILVMTAFPEGILDRDFGEKDADLYLTKPVSPSQLVAFVSKLLQPPVQNNP